MHNNDKEKDKSLTNILEGTVYLIIYLIIIYAYISK